MQARHGLADAGGLLPGLADGDVFAVGVRCHGHTDQAASPSGRAAASRPPQARQADLTANTQMTAPAYTAKLASVPVSTASLRVIGNATAARLASAAKA